MKKRKKKKSGGMGWVNGKIDRILFGCMGVNLFLAYLHRRLVTHEEGAWYFLVLALILFDSTIRNGKDPRFRSLSSLDVIIGGIIYSLFTILILYIQFCSTLLIVFIMEIVLIGITVYKYYYKD